MRRLAAMDDVDNVPDQLVLSAGDEAVPAEGHTHTARLRRRLSRATVRRQSRRLRRPRPDTPMLDALNDLLTYALVIEGERERAAEQLEELYDVPTDVSLEAELEHRVAELTADLEIIRATIGALRREADPSGSYL